MNYIHEHKNYKHIIKNRLVECVLGYKYAPRYVIKNDKGEYMARYSESFSADISKAEKYSGADNGFMLFNKATELNAKAYLLTIAGEIEIRPGDFK